MAIPSASEQQGPFPLLRLSNHGFRGDPAYRPSSRAVALPASSMVANKICRSDAQNELSAFMLVTDDARLIDIQLPKRSVVPSMMLPASIIDECKAGLPPRGDQ